MLSVSLHKLPFWLHSLIELVPSVVFLIDPASQLYASNVTSDLQSTSPEWSTAQLNPRAEAIIRQYAVLLFASVLISAIFAVRKLDITSRQVAAALTLYHCAPIVRATLRLWGGEAPWQPQDMGGPWVHLAVHVICFLALGSLASGAIRDQHEIKLLAKRD